MAISCKYRGNNSENMLPSQKVSGPKDLKITLTTRLQSFRAPVFSQTLLVGTLVLFGRACQRCVGNMSAEASTNALADTMLGLDWLSYHGRLLL